VKAQSEFKVALKDTQNDFTKKNYADFQSIVEAARPAMTANSLGFIQMPCESEKGLVLVTRIFHTSGQWYESTAPVKSQKEDPQSVGAAITYMKRYMLQAALGVVASDEDSDAEKAMNRGEERPSTDSIRKLLLGFEKLGVGSAKILDKYSSLKSIEDMTYDIYEDLVQIGTAIKKGDKADKYFKAVQK